MSHSKERTEKNCLNCNAQVEGRYCQICGQENTEPSETVWQLTTHFFNDLTHFDGKFFSTLRYLLAKPGFLSREYLEGRRAAYLNPVRMYIFTSAAFFLIFFSQLDLEKSLNPKTTIYNRTIEDIRDMDSIEFSRYARKFRGAEPKKKKDFLVYADSISKSSNSLKLDFGDQSDSIKKRNWFTRVFEQKGKALREKYNNDDGRILTVLFNAWFHSFPQMFFISLPLFAMILYLLYRGKHKYYFTNHLIFGFHLYIFVFLVLMIIVGIDRFENYAHIGWLNLVLIPLLFLYEYKAMRNFYLQSRGITLLKFIVLNILLLIVILVIFIFFFFFVFFKL